LDGEKISLFKEKHKTKFTIKNKSSKKDIIHTPKQKLKSRKRQNKLFKEKYLA